MMAGTEPHSIDSGLRAEALRTEANNAVVAIHRLGRNPHHRTRPDPSTADVVADIHAVVTQLGLRRPAIFRMGGTIALQVASGHPWDLVPKR